MYEIEDNEIKLFWVRFSSLLSSDWV